MYSKKYFKLYLLATTLYIFLNMWNTSIKTPLVSCSKMCSRWLQHALQIERYSYLTRHMHFKSDINRDGCHVCTGKRMLFLPEEAGACIAITTSSEMVWLLLDTATLRWTSPSGVDPWPLLGNRTCLAHINNWKVQLGIT